MQKQENKPISEKIKNDEINKIRCIRKKKNNRKIQKASRRKNRK